MSILNNSLLLGAPAGGAAGYQISRSLRFNSSDSAYLSRTPASAGNRKTWTWAGWVKRSSLGSFQQLFVAADSNYAQNGFDDSDRLRHYPLNNGSAAIRTTAVFRDPSAWYHIVYYTDTTAATASDRLRIYVNGVLQAVTGTYPAQNTDLAFNQAIAHNIGRYWSGSEYFNGYLADIHFIDGQALTPSSFGEFDTNGVWQPKAYTGSYGTNGFHLDFADNSSNTATTLGKDTSGNGNNWTPNNLSVTAGAGNDSLVDSPSSPAGQTDSGAGGTVVGNYCTWNPLFLGSGYTLVDGNLQINGTLANNIGSTSTFSMASGKWYWEVLVDAIGSSGDWDVGIANNNVRTSDATVGVNAGFGWRSSGSFRVGASTTYISAVSYTTGNILRFAFDADTRNFWVGKDASWLGGGNPATATNPTGQMNSSSNFFAAIRPLGTGSRGIGNWGARPFAYTAPSGFKALCTTNLPAPVVAKPSTVMDVALYTGNGGNQSITLPGGFNPDLVWVKSRSNSQDHYLFDAVRGGASILRSNTTGAESTGTTYLSFDTSGFSSLNGLSSNGYTYAAWCFDAGTATTTNTQGSITSQVRANPSAGFSVVTFTMGSGNNSVGHGLNVVPGLVISKARNTSSNWWVFMDPTLGSDKHLSLQTTNAVATLARGTSTSSLLAVDNNFFSNTFTYVSYCFAPVAGYTVASSYTGNGSADGPFVFTNMRPRWILIKRTDSTGNWTILDTAREGYNVDNDPLFPNLADAEGTADLADILSNGFKLRSTDASVNASGGTYIYYAIGENAFSLARAR